MHRQEINNQALWAGISEIMKGNNYLKPQKRQRGRVFWRSSSRGQYIIPNIERRQRRQGEISARQQRKAQKEARRKQ